MVFVLIVDASVYKVVWLITNGAAPTINIQDLKV